MSDELNKKLDKFLEGFDKFQLQINEKLDNINSRLDRLEEDTKDTRRIVNDIDSKIRHCKTYVC